MSNPKITESKNKDNIIIESVTNDILDLVDDIPESFIKKYEKYNNKIQKNIRLVKKEVNL